MQPTTAKLVTCIFTLALCSLATPTRAQSCPADVSELASQIEEPQLQTTISEPLDNIVGDAGGLEVAIGQWEQKLADARASRAELAAQIPTATRALDELIVILDRQLGGLKCRRDD